MRRLVLVLLLAGVFAGGASATTFNVHVINFTYTPDVLTVQPGDTVHWIWDTPSHSTTSDDGLTWDSGIHNTGFTFDHLFGGPGAGETFPYHCSFHGFGMAGTIKVGPPTAARFEDFSVARGAHGVTVRWRTASETATLGFDVFRQGYGARVRVNRAIVIARGGVSGHSYAFVDARAPRVDIPLRYWLRVRTLGGATWYGPQLLEPVAVPDFAGIFSS